MNIYFYYRYTYYEKAVIFLRTLFEKMSSNLSSHEVTIIMYGRLFYPLYNTKNEVQKELFKWNTDILPETLDQLMNWYNINKDNKIFQDVYFKLGIFEPSRNNWESFLKKLKKGFNYYPSLVKWHINNRLVKSLIKAYPASEFNNKFHFLNDSETLSEQFLKVENMLEWEISSSWTSNFLEAVNLSIRHLHLDQSTKHVGSQIVVLSAGTGVYKVCPDIAIPTRRRMLQNGIMTRIVSLRKPPKDVKPHIHSAVFIYKWFSSDHRRNAFYDPFSTKNDRFDKKLLLLPSVSEEFRPLLRKNINMTMHRIFKHWK